MTPEVDLLLVDSDTLVRSWLRLSLRATEFRVTTEASNAAEALELLEETETGLLLVAYDLPDQRGTELIREVRRRGNTAHAVMMTASGYSGFKQSMTVSRSSFVNRFGIRTLRSRSTPVVSEVDFAAFSVCAKRMALDLSLMKKNNVPRNDVRTLRTLLFCRRQLAVAARSYGGDEPPQALRRSAATARTSASETPQCANLLRAAKAV